jgi:O-methyltransferase
MMKIIIFGAGQSGRMIGKLIHGSCETAAYADNNYKNLADSIDGVSIISPEEIISMNADKIIISVLNKEAAKEIKMNLIEKGISNDKILNINQLRELFDIRLSTIRLLADEIKNSKVEGSIAELGVYKGYIARELNLLFKERRLYLFDTFEGFDKRDIEHEKEWRKGKSTNRDFSDTSIEQVKDILMYPEKVVFCKGYFPDTAASIKDKFAFVSLDPDLYLPTLNGLRFFYPRLSKGGSILIHDYNSAQFVNVKEAVREFSKEADIKIVPLSDLHGSAVIV